MTDGRTPRLGFVGLGDIGGPMAAHLIAHGLRPKLWARSGASFAQFENDAFDRASSLAELGEASEVIGICVFDDDDVRQVLLGDDGLLAAMAPGGVIAIHSTVAAETVVDLAAFASARGIAVLDAPVSGARVRALDGTLTILVGGDADPLERAMPMLRCYGGTIRQVGVVGDAQKMKALNNRLASANLGVAWLALEAGRAMGLDEDVLRDVLRTSSGASTSLAMLIDRMLDDPARCRHHVPMNAKDAGLFDRLREAAGVDRSSLDTAAEAAGALLRALGSRAT